MNASQKLIERAGGYRKLAELLNIPVTTAQYWWDKGTIPSSRQGTVLNTLNANGINVSPNDFFDAPKFRKGNGKHA